MVLTSTHAGRSTACAQSYTKGAACRALSSHQLHLPHSLATVMVHWPSLPGSPGLMRPPLQVGEDRCGRQLISSSTAEPPRWHQVQCKRCCLHPPAGYSPALSRRFPAPGAAATPEVAVDDQSVLRHAALAKHAVTAHGDGYGTTWQRVQRHLLNVVLPAGMGVRGRQRWRRQSDGGTQPPPWPTWQPL